jgi:hypothetical protein
MKVTALGVHGAFSVGQHRDMIDLMDLNKIIAALKDDGASVEDIQKEFVKRAYIPTWQSNFLIEIQRKDGTWLRIVIDFGGDIRHSLQNVSLSMNDIDIWYCSHPHQDHIGGIEGIALSTFFNPVWRLNKKTFLDGRPISVVVEKTPLPNDCKPELMAHPDVLKDVWPAAKPGLETLEGIDDVSLDTYFKVYPITDAILFDDYSDGVKRTWEIKPIRSLHVVNGRNFMNSWGLSFEEPKSSQFIYFPTDSQFMSPKQIRTVYNKSTVIYQDCETSPFPSDVHAHVNDLKTLPPEIKQKMLLYHYQETPTVGKHIDENEFKGVLKMGDTQEY